MGLLKNIARIAKALEVSNELDYWRCSAAVVNYNSPEAVKLRQIRQLINGSVSQNTSPKTEPDNFTQL